jgi:hypothetical protein
MSRLEQFEFVLNRRKIAGGVAICNLISLSVAAHSQRVFFSLPSETAESAMAPSAVKLSR